MRGGSIALVTLLGVLLTGATACAQRVGPVLAFITPVGGASYSFNSADATTGQVARAGSVVSVTQDAVVNLAIIDQAGGSIGVAGGAGGEAGTVYVGSTDPGLRRYFTLMSGAMSLALQGANTPTQITAGDRVLTCRRTVGAIRYVHGNLLVLVFSGEVAVRVGGDAPILVTDGQSLRLDSDARTGTASAASFPDCVDLLECGPVARQQLRVAAGGQSRASSVCVFGLSLLQLACLMLFVLQLATVVYPNFGDLPIVAAVVAMALECSCGLSRLWIDVADVHLPAGAVALSLIVVAWVTLEEATRWRRTTARGQVGSHVSKGVLVWLLALVFTHGLTVFNPQSAHAFTRLPRNQYALASGYASTVVTTPPQSELAAWELAGFVLPTLILVVRAPR